MTGHSAALHITSTARARAGITALTGALAMFGLLSSPLGFHVASPASAQPLAVAESLTNSAPYPFREYDTVLIDEPGYKLGGDGYTNGHPDNPASLTWTQNWYGDSFKLLGRIHFEGAERCARVKVISLNATGGQIGEPDYSDTECPGDLGHNARVITEGGNDGVTGRAGAAQAKVILQTQNVDLSFSQAGFQTVTYGPVLDTDSVKILSSYADLGSGTFNGTEPSAAATVTWNSTGGPVNPVVQATLFINNSHDLCFRTKVTYKKHDGVELEPARTGTERCVTDDALHTYPVLMNAFSHNEVAEVTYAIEKRGGTGVWEEVGQTTVELGDSILINTNPGPTLP